MPHESGESALAIGTVFQGGYEILAPLGAGRFGWVYKARQLSTGQDVAIKILRLLPGDTPGDIENQRARFRREMRLCAGLSHPNIVRLIDSGEADDGMLYAILEHVPGTTLREVLAEERTLQVPETLHLMTQVLDALACAHALGVVHRDLKPDNIMVTRTGVRRNALVLDFGLGGFTQEAESWALPRLTQTHEMMGTPCYAAPEQLRGEAPTTRSDLYSWGLIFLECLTGELAVGGASGHDVIMRQLGPEPVQIPTWLRRQRLGRLLEIVTAKRVEKRDITIAGLLEGLGMTQASPVSPAPATPSEQRSEGERRQLTVVSCRLSVAPLEPRALDPEEVDETLHTQHALYAQLAARAGGRMAGVLADRVLLVFGYPRAREDDARRAVRTALQVATEAGRAGARLGGERGLRLEARIGVHTGIVVVRDVGRPAEEGPYDLVGLTPQVAARLDERAAPGEVLVSGDTYRLLRGELSAEEAGDLQTWGNVGSVTVFRVTGRGRRVGPETTLVRETPLVGRSHQLGQLLERWAHTQAGKGGAVMITGEPGIGKSRLVRELRSKVPDGSWLECRCVPENQNSPLRPIVDLLTSIDRPIDAVLTRHGFDLAESLPLFASLLSIPLDDRYASLQLTPDRQKELTLEALVTLLVRMAADRPVVFALEDLHWADPTTLELATLLVREAQSAEVLETGGSCLCTIFTARPALTPMWSTEDVAHIPLSRLGREEVAEMVSAGLAGGAAVAQAVLDRIIRHADGVPLFVEEVTRMLLESSAASEHGGQRAIDDVGLEIPSSLRALLAARLDGLSPEARETVQLGAILGREFRYELLAGVSAKEESLLRADLRELSHAGLLFSRAGGRAGRYLFKHALIRDAAYDAMTRPTRQSMHARVAAVLQQRFADVERDQPETLAQHFERGGDLEAAITYWIRAGYRTVSRGAYVESIHHLQRGLEVLEGLPSRAHLREQELDLVQTLGMGLLATQGYASPAVEETFDRALRLCGELGAELPPLRVLSGLWGVQLTRSNREATAKLLPKFRQLAEGSTDSSVLLASHVTAGIRAFYTGDFAQAREEMVKGKEYYTTAGVRNFIKEFGYDGGIYTFGYLVWTLWMLGYPDQAIGVRDQMLALADAASNPYTQAVAWGFSANLAHDLGEAAAALEVTEKAIALATRQKLYFWLGPATCSHGWARVQHGDAEQGIGEIQQGLGLMQAIGVRTSYPYHLSFLVEAHLGKGAIDDGLAAADEGIGMCQTLLDCFYEPEFHRLRGELLRLRGEVVEAEQCFRRALEGARREGAKSLELRAATSLARLLRERTRIDEARALLAPVYEWFTEGFTSRDLRDAKAVGT
jgi:TOMM system kinase/cyclase fusion protein